MTMTLVSNSQISLPAKLKVPSVFAGKAWQQVLARDASADGRFVYAVKTTRIFCRPSCPSRRPERKNVSFFPTPELARAAGYRACLRCEPESAEKRDDPQVKAIDAVASYLTEHSGERTRLKDVAKATGVAPLTILRGFKRVLGVSPREYAKAQRVAQFKEKVRAPRTSVTDAIYEAGFGSSSRLYESKELGMTPSAMKAGGAGQTIRYTTADSPLGQMLVAATSRGICAIAFGDTEDALFDDLTRRYPKAEIKRMDAELGYAVEAVVGLLGESPRAVDLDWDVRATAFQWKVWKALQAIPRGTTKTYAQIAEEIGSPGSARAVGGAIGRNPLALAVPCHRVIGSDGSLTGWHWGVERKQRLLAMERES
jgi:AraC family transcriptional regulator of adaptative response/methylated-DNA-[protein]-cysteine methyltransferase